MKQERHLCKSRQLCGNELSGSALVRRRLMKLLSISGGATTGVALIPRSWLTPVVEAVLLPAHAQSSPIVPPVVAPFFQLQLLDVPFTGEVVSLTQDGSSGVLTLRPGLKIPPDFCQANFAFVGSGYTVTVEGDRPVGDIDIRITGKPENWMPGLTECSGVDMIALIDGPQQGCYAADTPLNYTFPADESIGVYQGFTPVAYKVKPCQQGCANVADGYAGSIVISDDTGVIPSLTIDVMMQGSCI